MHDDDTTPIMAAQWWKARMQGSGLGWLQDTSYNLIDHSLICALWKGDTRKLRISTFHLGR